MFRVPVDVDMVKDHNQEMNYCGSNYTYDVDMEKNFAYDTIKNIN